MAYDDRLWDESDPNYAPGLSWSKTVYAWWQAPKKYVDAGYAFKRINLHSKRDETDQAAIHARAARCRELTRDMVRWYEGIDQPKVAPDTWAYVFSRYKSDEFSPLANVKPTTTQHYLDLVAKLEVAVGHLRVADLTYEVAMQCKIGMEAKGRSRDYVKRFFRQLRACASYANVLQLPGAAQACVVLSGIRTKNVERRSVAPTRKEVMAIVHEADRRGLDHFALGILLCFELCLRAVDVRGQWGPQGDDLSGIIRNGQRWQDGLTWDMIDLNALTIRKTISKTGGTFEWSLEHLPEVMRRLENLSGRAGPVIINADTGLPYTKSGWSTCFRRIKNHLIKMDKAAMAAGEPVLGINPELTAMDIRAGGITEAKALVSNNFELRDAAQHSDVSTTSRYARDNSAGANTVIELRQRASK